MNRRCGERTAAALSLFNARSGAGRWTGARARAAHGASVARSSAASARARATACRAECGRGQRWRPLARACASATCAARSGRHVARKELLRWMVPRRKHSWEHVAGGQPLRLRPPLHSPLAAGFRIAIGASGYAGPSATASRSKGRSAQAKSDDVETWDAGRNRSLQRQMLGRAFGMWVRPPSTLCCE